MNILKIVLGLLPILIFSGCFRVIPDSTVLPTIRVDKNFSSSKKLVFNEIIMNISSSNNGLIIIKFDMGVNRLIDSNSNKIIKEIKGEFTLISDLPNLIFSTYNRYENITKIQSINIDGKSIWENEFTGELLSSYQADSIQNILISSKNNNITTISTINQNTGKISNIFKTNFENKVSMQIQNNSMYVVAGGVLNIYNSKGIKKYTIELDVRDKSKFINFLNTKDKNYVVTDNSVNEITKKGLILNSYIFDDNINVNKVFIDENNILTIYGYIDEKSEAIINVIDLNKKKITFKKIFEETLSSKDEDYLYNDILVNDNTLYIVNNNKLISIDISTGKLIKNQALNINEDSYETLYSIFVHKNKIIIMGNSEIYAYNKDDFTPLWKYEEFWTPQRLFAKENGFNSMIMAGALAGNASLIQSGAVGGKYAMPVHNFSVSMAVIGHNFRVIAETLSSSQKSINKENIAFIRGYSTGTLMLEYDAVVYLIDLDTGKSEIIQLKERDSYHCFPNVYVDLHNKTIYQAYGTQNLILRCDTLNQLDIFKY